MTKAQALTKARALLGNTAFVEDRRKRDPKYSMAGKVVIGERSGPFGFGHLRGWGETWEAALAHVARTIGV